MHPVMKESCENVHLDIQAKLLWQQIVKNSISALPLAFYYTG